MNQKSFAIIILAILLAQPLVVISSIGIGSYGISAIPTSMPAKAQDAGTRLTPEEHTNHIPIIIDGNDDFDTQGWPGDGSQGDPYLITGLNITYDVGLELVAIYNTDAHFIIRDCYLNQGNTLWTIHLENVSNAVIEYVTILSYNGIFLNNVTDSSLSHIDVYSDDTDAIKVQLSENIDILSNILTGRRLYVLESSGIVATGNTVLDAGASGVVISDSNSTIFTSNIISETGSIGLNLDNSSHCWIQYNHINNTGGIGIYLRLSENTTLWNNEIIEAGNNGIDFESDEWISIKNNLLNNTGAFPIYTADSSNGEIISNIVENSPSNVAIGFQILSHNFTITDNYIENTWGGIFTSSGSNISMYRNTIINVGQYFIAAQSIPDSNIINNTCVDSDSWGIYGVGALRLNIAGNTFNTSVSQMIYLTTANNTVEDNFIYDTSTGVECTVGAVNAHLVSNRIIKADLGISIIGDDAYIASNTITDTNQGIVIAGSADEAEVFDNIIDEAFTYGISIANTNSSVIGNTFTNSGTCVFLNSATDPEVKDNIFESSRTGIASIGTTGGVFENNNMTDCGFYFNSGQTVAQLNHTFADNNVNDKPLYYALNESGLALNGNDYGEIILVNCSDSSIDGGIFTWSTTAIQLYHSDRIDVSGVQIVDQWWGMDLYMSNNVTIYDSTFSGRGFGDALNAWFADGIEIENVNFTNINGIGIDLAEADPFTIRNCLFENLADSGIETYSTQTGLIEDCEFYNTTYGIYFDGTSNTLVTESQFLWNTYGLYSVTESDDNNVTFSSFHDNMYGIRMDDSFSWNIYNNSIAWNDYGIYITTTDDAQVIYNNTFLLNTIYNGYDSGADDWDDHVDGGNYWHDYSGSGVYNIPGGSSVDNYPISYMVYQPIINTPADIWYAEGSTGNYIVWWPFDNSLRDWVVEIDSSEWDSGIWNFNNVNVSIDGLSYGTHTVFVTVWDVDTNFVTDTVIVHVFDDTPPEIDGPANQWLFVDATGQEIDWEVFDLNPADYVLTVDGVEFDTGSWDSGILSLDVDDIDEGEHVLVLTIYDVDGNSASDTVLVRVIDDNVNPTIVDPDDIIYTEGTTGNNIVWDAEDAYPASFEVRYNNTVLYSGSWGGARIIVNVDGLTPGIYEYELRVYDMSNNMATSTVNVTVIPVVPVEPPLIIDWFLVAVIGAVIGGAIVVIVIVYYMRKRTASS